MFRVLFFVLLMAPFASAQSNFDNFIAGPIPGNDSADLVSSILNRRVDEVGKFELFENNVCDLTIYQEGVAVGLNLDLQRYTVDGTSWDYLVAKSGPQFWLFRRTGDLTPFFTGTQCLSHVTLYKGSPEPTGLMALGLPGLLFWRKRR